MKKSTLPIALIGIASLQISGCSKDVVDETLEATVNISCDRKISVSPYPGSGVNLSQLPDTESKGFLLTKIENQDEYIVVQFTETDAGFEFQIEGNLSAVKLHTSACYEIEDLLIEGQFLSLKDGEVIRISVNRLQ